MPGRSVPPSAQGSGGRPWLIAAIIVLSLALIAMLWFSVRPMLLGGGAPKSSGVGANAPDSGQPTTTDTFGPMSWSAPLTIADANDFSASPVAAPVVRESGIDGIDLAGWALDGGSYHLQAVDSSTLRALWGPTQFHILAATQDGIVTAGVDGGTVGVLDPHTGNTIGTALSWQNYANTSVGGGMILAMDHSDPANVTVCGQKITAPGKCVWTKSGPRLTLSQVFGGDTWVDLGPEVVDVATGELAPFGKRPLPEPDSSGTIPIDTFVGPTKDRILHRFNGYQLWDPQTDSARGPTMRLGGYLMYDSELPNFMTAASDGTVTAYSWQTGEQQWQTRLAPGFGSGPPYGGDQIYGNTLLVVDYSPSPSDNPLSTAGVWAVDAATGQITGHHPAPGFLSGVVAGVAYLKDGNTLTAVDATTLAPLGSLAYPAPNSWVGVVGGHVAAMTQSGQYYVLQT